MKTRTEKLFTITAIKTTNTQIDYEIVKNGRNENMMEQQNKEFTAKKKTKF